MSEHRACLSVARTILGALDAPDGVLLRCGLGLGHQGRHTFHMEWSDPPAHDGGRLITDEIAAYLASRRDDPGFRDRLAKRMERDKEVLRRLDDEAARMTAAVCAAANAISEEEE